MIQLELVSHRPPFPELAEQAPPHEMHQQPFNRNSSRRKSRRKQQQTQQQMMLRPHSPHRTQSRNLHQLQFKCTETRQAAQQATPHESAPAALQQKHHQKEQQMVLIPQGPKETQSKNRHQLQFKCAETRQAAHRIAETASRPARAGAPT